LEAGGLQLDAHAGAGIQGLASDVVAGYADGPRRCLDQAFGRAQRAGLTGAVGAEQAEDLAWQDFERDIPDGLEIAVVDVQVFNLEDGMVG
jgi:hypothetical protein